MGLKSTALYLGNRTVPVLTAMSMFSGGAFCVAGGFHVCTPRCAAGCGLNVLSCAGVMGEMAWPYFAGAGAATAHMLWQVHTADLEDRWNLTTRFVSNKWTGLAVFAGAVASNLVG